MSYIEESLSTGEQVEGRFDFHWIAWLPVIGWVILGFVALGFAWLAAEQDRLWLLLGIAALAIAWLIALTDFLRLKFVEQGVTNKRVILKRGIISRHTEEMKLTSIETVEIDQGIVGRIFGFGTVKLTGRGISDLFFRRIDDPLSVKRQIESISNPAG